MAGGELEHGGVPWQEEGGGRVLNRVQGEVRVLAEAETQVDALLHGGQELGHGQLHLGLQRV